MYDFLKIKDEEDAVNTYTTSAYAKIMINCANHSVWCDVFPSENEWEVYHSDSIYCLSDYMKVKDNGNIYEERLQDLALKVVYDHSHSYRTNVRGSMAWNKVFEVTVYGNSRDTVITDTMAVKYANKMIRAYQEDKNKLTSFMVYSVLKDHRHRLEVNMLQKIEGDNEHYAEIMAKYLSEGCLNVEIDENIKRMVRFKLDETGEQITQYIATNRGRRRDFEIFYCDCMKEHPEWLNSQILTKMYEKYAMSFPFRGLGNPQ